MRFLGTLGLIVAVAFLAPGWRSGEIRLIRAHPAIVRAACKAAQAHVQLRVTCPTLIPQTRYVTREGLSGEMDYSRSLWAITFNNGDNGPGFIHWIVGGGTISAVRYYLLSDKINEVKGLPKLISTSVVDGYAVSVYEYPYYPAGGTNGSHTAAFIRCGTSEVFASIHGHGHAAAATAMAVDLARRARCR